MTAAVAASIFAIFVPLRAAAQSFEVASIKPNTAGPGRGNPMRMSMGGPGTPDPERLTFRNLTLRLILLRAFDANLNDSYSVSIPKWTDDESFDIDAKIPADATKEQVLLMLQNLLAERFGMKFHREKRDVPAYDLVIAKGGVKMKESSPSAEPISVDSGGRGVATQRDRDGKIELAPGKKGMMIMGMGGGLRITARSQSAADIVNMCRNQTRSLVFDKTGLTGVYDFNLDFTRDGAPPAEPSPGANAPLSDAKDAPPPFLVAIQSLGLKLEPTKTNVDVVIIDHLEKVPTEN